MDAAYDDQVYVDDRTIDSHIKRLRKKFKAVDDDFEMIETLYGVGYRFKESLSGRRSGMPDGRGRSMTVELDGRLAAPQRRRRCPRRNRCAKRSQPGSASRCASGCAGCAARGPARVVQPVRRIVVLNLAGLIALLRRLPLPQPVPRRADRRAGAEPAHPGRDHRRRDRRLRHRRHRLDHHRPRQAAAARRPARAWAWATTACSNSPINPERVAPLLRRLVHADAHARPHLRSRRLPRGRQPLALFARRHPALRPAAARRRTSPTIVERTWNAGEALASAAASCRSTEEINAANGRNLPGGARRALRLARQRRARQRQWRDHRVGRRADPALPGGARRAADVHPGRRHRRHHRGRALAILRVFLSRRGVMIVLSVLLRGHHRGADPPPVRRRGPRAPRRQGARGNPRFHRPLATRSAISPARCAT